MNATANAEPEAPVLEKRLVDEGTLFDALPVAPPPAELASRLAERIAEHLERAAWWPDHEARTGLRLGEFSSYSIGFKCRDFRTLYVLVETEPFCEATVEISSSEADPELAASAPEAMKAALERRGFRPGGARAGFQRAQRLQSVEDCQAAADAIAGLMTHSLGYDESRPVSFKFDLHQRAKAEPVVRALSLGDVARLLRQLGLVVWRFDLASGKPGWRTVGRPRFDVAPIAETSPGSRLYAGLFLTFSTRFSPEGSEAVEQHVGAGYVGGDVFAQEDGRVFACRALTLAGGVTESHLRIQLLAWRKFLRRIMDVGCREEADDD